MNDTLTHPLNLPKIGGSIVAYFDWNFTVIKRLKKIHKSVILYRYLYEDDYILKLKEDKSYHLFQEILGDSLKEGISCLEKYEKPLSQIEYWEIVKKLYPNQLDKQYSAKWNLKFHFSGPDARYLPAMAILEPKEVKQLVKNLEESFEKMINLANSEFKGNYRKTITNTFPILELIAENNSVSLNFWINSKNWQYSKTLSIEDTVAVIEELKNIENKAKQLMSSLEEIGFK